MSKLVVVACHKFTTLRYNLSLTWKKLEFKTNKALHQFIKTQYRYLNLKMFTVIVKMSQFCIEIKHIEVFISITS